MKKIYTYLLSLMFLYASATEFKNASALQSNTGNNGVNVNVNVNVETPKKENPPQSKAVCVGTLEELKSALKNDNIELVTLTENIDAVGPLSIDRPVVLDLNGYKIQFITDNSLVIGSVSRRSVEKTKYNPGHWEKKPTRYKIIEEGHYEEKKIPGHFECGDFGNYWVNERIEKNWIPEKKEALPDEYQWVDGHNYKVNEIVYVSNDIDVLIKNGYIYGKNGRNGFYNRYYKDGLDGSHAIVIKSGTLTLKNVFVKGGNGGNGRDGDTVIGRSGGDGGNGGDAVHLYGGEVYTADNTCLKGGKGGKGGKKNHTGWTSIFCREGLQGNDGE